MPPKAVDKITGYVNGIDNMFTVKRWRKPQCVANLVHIIGEDVDEDYLAGVKYVSLTKLIDSGKTWLWSTPHYMGPVIIG